MSEITEKWLKDRNEMAAERDKEGTVTKKWIVTVHITTENAGWGKQTPLTPEQICDAVIAEETWQYGITIEHYSIKEDAREKTDTSGLDAPRQ